MLSITERKKLVKIIKIIIFLIITNLLVRQIINENVQESADWVSLAQKMLNWILGAKIQKKTYYQNI